MLNNALQEEIVKQLATKLNQQLHKVNWQPVGGGDINICYQLSSSAGDYFIKLNRDQKASAMFAAEAEGLSRLSACEEFTVPKPILTSHFDSVHFLVMQFIALKNHGQWQTFAHALAGLHAITQPEHGLASDNFIGTTPQLNSPTKIWSEFWWVNRILPQLNLCEANGYQQLSDLKSELLNINNQVLNHHTPTPSLLHGDLWSGNAAFSQQSKPCIYDPAIYFGDRETDLALTELFGGFPAEFYQSYNNAWPIEEGYTLRKHWYNLYHLLNHANLFGGHYPSACLQQLEKIKRML